MIFQFLTWIKKNYMYARPRLELEISCSIILYVYILYSERYFFVNDGKVLCIQRNVFPFFVPRLISCFFSLFSPLYISGDFLSTQCWPKLCKVSYYPIHIYISSVLLQLQTVSMFYFLLTFLRDCWKYLSKQPN